MIIWNLLAAVSLAVRVVSFPASRPYSEEFFLVAYKIPDNRVDQNSQFSQLTSNLQQSGFQLLVFDDDFDIVVNSNINSSKYNISGRVNQDLSVELTRFPSKADTFLTVGEKLEFSHDPSTSEERFSVYHNNLLYFGSNEWVVCQKGCGQGEDETVSTTLCYNKPRIIPKSVPHECQELSDVVLRAYGYPYGDLIPDYPL